MAFLFLQTSPKRKRKVSSIPPTFWRPKAKEFFFDDNISGHTIFEEFFRLRNGRSPPLRFYNNLVEPLKTLKEFLVEKNLHKIYESETADKELKVCAQETLFLQYLIQPHP